MDKEHVIEKSTLNPVIRILRHHEVCERIGLSSSKLFALVAEGRFPRSFQIVPGGRSRGWLEQDVTAWILERKGVNRG